MADPKGRLSPTHLLFELTDDWHEAVPWETAYDGPTAPLWWIHRIAEELHGAGHYEAAVWLRGQVEGIRPKRDAAGTFGIEADNLAA